MLKIPLFVLVTVVTLNFSLAQSQDESNSDDHHSHSPNFFGFPLPSNIPQFPFHLPFLREEQAEGPPPDAPDVADLAPPEHHDHEHQDRFFFGLIHPASTLVSCNYTTEAGARCTSCTTALACGTANVGRQRICRGFFPYCNLGRCSFLPGELCANSTG